MNAPGFSRSALSQAIEQARLGPYVAGARVTRPWLRLLGLAALAALILIGVTVALGVALALADAPAFSLEGAIADGPERLYGESVFVAVLAGSLILLALAILAAAMIVYRRRAPAFLWPERPFSARLLWTGFAVMAGLSLILFPIGLWLEPGRTPPLFDAAYPLDSRLTYAAATAGFLLIAAAAEEIAFRAVLLRVVAGLTQRVWLICLVNALLFSAIHLDPDPVAFVARALSGLVWTWAALRLGGIEFAIGAHWANNLFIAWLNEPMSEAALPGQGIPVEYLAFEVVVVIVVFAAVERIARRGGRPRVA